MDDAVGTSAPIGSRTPTHLWLTGILATLWTGFGCYDYVMTQSKNRAYLDLMGDQDMAAYFTSFPTWAIAFWAIGVWGSLLGSLLLLARSGWAVHAYGASLIGLVVMAIYQFGISNPPAEMMTPGMWALTIIIWIVAITLFTYARVMARRGVLR